MSSTGLPRYWRIQVYNDTGVDSGGNIEVTAILTKTNSSGVIQYDVETDLFAAAEILADDHGDGDPETLRQMKYPVNLSTIEDHDDKYPNSEQIKELGRWADCLDRI